MNRKLSSFESINAKDINKDLTYVSAVQKLSDGSYKNINIPLAQLSGLWNDDVKTAVANADFEGGAIDAEVIHQAALNAVENAIASAEAAIEEATNKANQLVNDYNTGNTQTQILIREAQERLDQQITSAIDKVSQIQTMYDQYFGAGGIVEQKASEANRALNQAQDALNDAQDLLDRLNNGEIVPTGIEDLSRKINNLETLWGQKGTWVSEEDATNRIMTQFENYIDLLTASKKFSMTYANGSTGEVKKFTDFLNLMKGEYEKVLSKVDTVNQQYLEMGERWDEASETMKQFVTKTDLSDEINPVVDSAVRKTSAKLIEDAVYSATMQVVGELLFEQSTEVGTKKLVKIKDSQLYYNFLPDTSYYLRWDGNTDDDAVNIYYQFIIVDSNASFNSSNWASNTNYSEDNWNLLTNDAIRSIGEPTTTVDPNSQQTVEVPDTRTRYLALKYTGYSESGSKTLSKQCKVTAQIEKYMSAAQLQISAKEAVLSAFENDPGVRQRLSELKVGQREISQAVNNYFKDNEFDAAGIKNTADQVSTYVLEYLKNSDGTYKTLESEISSTKEAIEQTVIDASLTSKAVWNKTKASEYNLTINYSIDQAEAKANLDKLVKHYELETGHEYILKGRDLDVLFYTLNSDNRKFNANSTVFDQNSTYEWSDNPFGNWVKAENPNSIKIVIPNVGGNSNSKILSFYIKVKKVKGNSNNLVYLDNPEVEIFETVNSKMGNFKVSANAITETLFDTEAVDGNGENVITKIYNRLATADGVQTTIGQVASGFVNQSTFNNTVDRLESSIMSIGGTVQGNQFVKQSDFDQKVDEIKLNVSEVGYTALENALCSVNYSNGSYIDGEYQSGKSYTLQDSGYQGNRYYYQNLENETGAAIILCKIKLINPDTDHLLFVNNADKYTIAKMWLYIGNDNNLNSVYGDSIMGVWYDPLSDNKNEKKLRPFKSVSSGTSYAYIALMLNKVQKTPVLASKNDLNGTKLNLKVGIPTDVAVSNIKQTADSITEQVSSLNETWGPNGNKTQELNTALQKITSNSIESVVAKEINGKLAGYSTIQQTADYIASTVGAGASSNKFKDSLFKNGLSYWGTYANSDDIIFTTDFNSTTNKKSYPGYPKGNSSSLIDVNVTKPIEKELSKTLIFQNALPTLTSSFDITKKPGIYQRFNLTPGKQYTASFFIKLCNDGKGTSDTQITHGQWLLQNNSFSYEHLKLNMGCTEEIALSAPKFYIAPIDESESLDSIISKSYKVCNGQNLKDDKNEPISFKNFIRDMQLDSHSPYYLYNTCFEFDNCGILNSSDATNESNLFNNGSTIDEKFGLWINFGEGKLGEYLNAIFNNNNSYVSLLNEGPNYIIHQTTGAMYPNGTVSASSNYKNTNNKFKWFKIWFTFTPQTKHWVSGNSLTKYEDNESHSFSIQCYSTKRFFCEIGAPMLNAGTIPLKFSSQEPSNGEQYSTVSQTRESIDMSIKSYSKELHEDLEQVGIHLDGNNSSITFNARTSAFTGAVKASSFEVAPSGSKANIKLIIYDPDNKKTEQAQIIDIVKDKYLKGTPLLVVTDENENLYIVDLTKINTEGKATPYWKIYSEDPTGSQIIISIGEPNNGIIYGLNSDIVLRKFNTSQANIYKIKYIAEQEIERTNIGTISFSKIGQNLNKFFNFSNPPENISINIPFKRSDGTTSSSPISLNKYCLNSDKIYQDEPRKGIFDLQNVDIVPINALKTPIFIEQYHSGIPIYKYDKYQGHARKLGETKLYRVYKDFSDGKLVDFRSGERYCFTCGNKFIGFCGYAELVRRYNLYLNANNYSSPDYAPSSLSERLKSIAEYFIKDSVFEAGLSNDLYINDYDHESFEAYTPTNCRVFFNKSDINFISEIIRRGVLEGLSKLNY